MARKNFGMKNFFFSFATFVIAIYIFRNFKAPANFMVAENGILEDVIKADGIIVKDEKIYKSNLDGSVLYYFDEGAKIREGQLIAELSTDVDSAEVNRQIAEIQSAINNKENNKESLSAENITAYQNEIQECILNNDLQNMYSIIGKVNNSYDFFDSYSEYTVQQLKDMKNSLMKGISTNRIPYYADRAGIITYKTDGLEDIYKFENILEITPSNTKKQEYSLKDKRQTVTKDESFVKVIRNFEYYIAATVDNEKAKLFEENKYIKTRILSDGEKHEVWGYIKKINYGSEESVLILFFDDYFYKVYDKRYVGLELITAIHEGLLIKNEALTDVNGITGVYAKDASNIIKFFPVEILGKNEENTVISTGNYVAADERRIIKIGNENFHTIKIFDKVILEPDKVYEGQIAD